MSNLPLNDLTQAQNELYLWIKNYMKDFQHSPSIRQMMEAMSLEISCSNTKSFEASARKGIYIMARRESKNNANS